MNSKKIIIPLFFLFSYLQLIGQGNNLVPCKKGKYYCFCDSSDNVVLRGRWEYVSKFRNGYALVRTKKLSGYIDSTGKYESKCSFPEMGRFHNGLTWASDKLGEINIIDRECNIRFSRKHNWGEHGAAFFDDVIVVYALDSTDNECGDTDCSYGAIDYNFRIVIPFNYENMLKSSSDRYYFVSKVASKKVDGNCPMLWGIYDIVGKQECVPCTYKGSLGGQINYEQDRSSYLFKCERGFFNEMEKLKISLPETDEISDQINGLFPW